MDKTKERFSSWEVCNNMTTWRNSGLRQLTAQRPFLTCTYTQTRDNEDMSCKPKTQDWLVGCSRVLSFYHLLLQKFQHIAAIFQRRQMLHGTDTMSHQSTTHTWQIDRFLNTQCSSINVHFVTYLLTAVASHRRASKCGIVPLISPSDRWPLMILTTMIDYLTASPCLSNVCDMNHDDDDQLLMTVIQQHLQVFHQSVFLNRQSRAEWNRLDNWLVSTTVSVS